MNASDGLNRRKLTEADSSTENNSPNWSPDDTKIAFNSSRPVHAANDTDQEIYVMDTQGQNLVLLTDNTSINDTSPSWWP
jgi:Tol biopolymer transport system component